MEKRITNFHTKGIFYEEFIRKKTIGRRNKGLSDKEMYILKFIEELKKAKNHMMEIIKEKDKEIEEAVNENRRLRTLSQELKQTIKYKTSSISLLKSSIDN